MPLHPSSSTQAYWQARRHVGGAFWDIDFLVFDQILSGQQGSGITGDLLEIGAAYGKSAIVLGLHAAPCEETIICDIFDNAGVNDANTLENKLSYPALSRDAFEANYLRWVQRPPRIVQEFSSGICSHVKTNSLRFAHLDGGHHYDVVSDDLGNASRLLVEAGVLVLDDFRALHTPGVAAAAWKAVANEGLIPFCSTEQKLYATWSAATADRMAELLVNWARGHGAKLNAATQIVVGHELLIIENPEGTSLRNRVGRMIPPAVRTGLRGRPKRYLGQPL